MTQTKRPVVHTTQVDKRHNTHHLLRGRRPGVTTRSTFALPESDPVMVDEPSAHAVFIQVTTKTTMYRGRRPGVATRSTFALPESDPVMVDEPSAHAVFIQVATHAHARQRLCLVKPS